MKVYLVFDESTALQDELIGVYATESAARAGIRDFLVDRCGYTPEEWAEFARDCGYKTVQDFQDAIQQSDIYDEDMEVRVQEEIVMN